MTTLVGKDASLEDTLSHFKRVAKELDIEFIEEQWLNPLPDLWSVHLSVASCPAIYSNGKGATQDAALASAYGEIYERLATHMSFADFFLGQKNSEDSFVHFKDEKWTALNIDNKTPIPDDVLNPKLRELYTSYLQEEDSEDEEELVLDHLVDIQSSAFERGVCSIPFTNVRTKEVVYFPVNLLDNLYASNGMSAGNSEYEALVQGLSEIIERYVKAKIIREGLTLPRVPEKILEKYPKSHATLQALQSDELKTICYDASLGGKYPVVCVVLFNESNGTCVASFGSHPIFEVALERTLTELMQGRTFSDLDGFDEPSFDEEKTSDIINIESHFVDSTGFLPMSMFKAKSKFQFVAWDFKGSTQEQYKALRHIINKLGYEIYIRAYKNLGVNVYRIIVPGMSEIYPYADLVYNNTNKHIAYLDAILALPEAQEEIQTYKEYLNEIENDDIPDDHLVAKILGLLPDPQSSWASLRIGELKCLIALEAEEYEKAKELAQWTVIFNSDLDLERQRFYRCLIKVIECKFERKLPLADYQEALALIFGESTFNKVIAHIEHKEKFNGLSASNLELDNFKQHQEMIKIYNKIKNASLKL